jgi:hypothetical protein
MEDGVCRVHGMLDETNAGDRWLAPPFYLYAAA